MRELIYYEEEIMKCRTCKKMMKYSKDLRFNEFKMSGYYCTCGEEYYDSECAQRVLIMNKLRKQVLRAKLGRIKSNLILRVPKEIETILNLHEGEHVRLKLERDGLKVIPC